MLKRRQGNLSESMTRGAVNRIKRGTAIDNGNRKGSLRPLIPLKNLEGARHGLWLTLLEEKLQTKKLNEHGTLVSQLELLCDATVLVPKETDTMMGWLVNKRKTFCFEL